MDDVLVLWDIDGTLLNADGVGRDLYGAVFLQLFGRSLSAYAPMAGRTDRAIILETLGLAGVDEPRRHVDPFIAGLCQHAPSVRSAVADRGHALPGAAAVLATLASARTLASLAAAAPFLAAPALTVPPMTAQPVTQPTGAPSVAASPLAAPTVTASPLTAPPMTAASAAASAPASPLTAQPLTAQPLTAPAMAAPATGALAMGAPAMGADPANGPGAGASGRIYQSVLTGNIRSVAEVKLAALGLREWLDLCIGAYGDDHEDRTELVAVARRRAAAVHGRSAAAFDGTATVVIGDTPLDIAAALAAGARAVGVATGSYTADDLAMAGADAVLPDLTDTAAVLRALLP
jgi:phosphoglycolate phosphatase-like HAD superfamily hydrolase